MTVKPRPRLDALAGCSLALSISDSEDLAPLGLLPVHLQLALAELARIVFVGGARLLYAGDMRAGGHTELLHGELERYAAAKGSLTVCLAWSVHRRTPLAALEAFNQALGVRGELLALDSTGTPLADWRTDRPAGGIDDLHSDAKAAAYEGMRQHLSGIEDARIAVAGRRGDGRTLPGVLHEVQISLARKHPGYLVGGFGGTVLDMAAAIEPAIDGLRAPTAARPGAAAQAALDLLRQQATEAGGWALLANGLDADENLRLAGTHRPSELAALVAIGLARLAGASTEG